MIKTAIILSLIAIAILSYATWYYAIEKAEQHKGTLIMKCIYGCRLYDNYKIDITFKWGLIYEYTCQCSDDDGYWARLNI